MFQYVYSIHLLDIHSNPADTLKYKFLRNYFITGSRSSEYYQHLSIGASHRSTKPFTVNEPEAKMILYEIEMNCKGGMIENSRLDYILRKRPTRMVAIEAHMSKRYSPEDHAWLQDQALNLNRSRSMVFLEEFLARYFVQFWVVSTHPLQLFHRPSAEPDFGMFVHCETHPDDTNKWVRLYRSRTNRGITRNPDINTEVSLYIGNIPNM